MIFLGGVGRASFRWLTRLKVARGWSGLGVSWNILDAYEGRKAWEECHCATPVRVKTMKTRGNQQ